MKPTFDIQVLKVIFLTNCQCQFLLLFWLRSLWLSWTMSCKRAKLNPMKMKSEQSPFTIAPNESWMHFQKLGWNIFFFWYKSCTVDLRSNSSAAGEEVMLKACFLLGLCCGMVVKW